jgi:hypothetical protein
VEEEETVGPTLAQPRVQRLDPAAGRREDGGVLGQVAGRRVREVAQDREVDVGVEVPEGEDLEVLELALDARDAGEQRGHDDQGPSLLRDPGGEVEPRQPPRWSEAGRDPLDERDGHLARGDEEQEGHPELRPGRAALVPDVPDPGRDERRRRERERPEVRRRGVREREPAQSLPEPGAPGHVGLEVAPTLPDEVVPHVRAACPRPLGVGRLASALHRAQGDAHLGLPGAVGELLDRLPVPVAGEELHAPVHAGGIALQHPLDEAHRLDVAGPVERRAEPQAPDDVRHRHLIGGLALVLAADGLLRRLPLGGEVLLESVADRREPRPVLAHALEELHDERGVEHARQRGRRSLPGGVDPGHVGVGRATGRARGERVVREAPEVLDERELQHARPRPELTDGERGDRLEGVQPAHELGAIEPAVAVADELNRERVDAGAPRLLAHGELGQLAVVAAGEVLANVPDLGGDEVEVVEEPLGRGRHELAPVHVAGERAVRLAQAADVVLEAREHAPRRPSRRVHREPGRERARPLVEALHAEELVPERLLGSSERAAPAAEERRVESRCHEHAPSRTGVSASSGRCVGLARPGI